MSLTASTPVLISRLDNNSFRACAESRVHSGHWQLSLSQVKGYKLQPPSSHSTSTTLSSFRARTDLTGWCTWGWETELRVCCPRRCSDGRGEGSGAWVHSGPRGVLRGREATPHTLLCTAGEAKREKTRVHIFGSLDEDELVLCTWEKRNNKACFYHLCLLIKVLLQASFKYNLNLPAERNCDGKAGNQNSNNTSPTQTDVLYTCWFISLQQLTLTTDERAAPDSHCNFQSKIVLRVDLIFFQRQVQIWDIQFVTFKNLKVTNMWGDEFTNLM